MDLSERKKKILSAVIDENLVSAEPVSSKQLQQSYLTNLSSATIRNELATLEELGLLYHPHTSAGRLPTLLGIKYYINQILPTIKQRQFKNLAVEFDANLENMSSLLKSTAKAISEATNYTSIMYIGVYDFAKINQVGLLKLDSNHALAAIITDRGIIKDVVDLKNTSEELDQASKILTNMFKGKTLRQLENSDFIITQEIEKYKVMFEILVEMVSEQEKQSAKLAIEGKDKIFNYPEFSSVDKLKKVVSAFENPNKISAILNEGSDDVEINVELGEDDFVDDCAIVTASYKVGGKTVGKAGVLGPVRMDYKNVISILKGFADDISKKLEENNKGE